MLSYQARLVSRDRLLTLRQQGLVVDDPAVQIVEFLFIVGEQVDTVLSEYREQQVALIDPLANLKITQRQHPVAVAPLVQNRLADGCVLGNDIEQPRLHHECCQ